MARRIDVPRDIYPVDEWAVIETRPHPDLVGRSESLFALSNGFLGVRGTYDSGSPVHEAGTIINGFHESWRITYPEPAYGFATKGQTIVRVPDATLLEIHVDGEHLRFDLSSLECSRRLDLRRGTLEQHITATVGSGCRTEVITHRLVSLALRNLIAMEIEIRVDRPAAVEVFSQLVNAQAFERFEQMDPRHDPRKAPGFEHLVLDPTGHSTGEARLVAGYVTARSRLQLGCGIDHVVDRENAYRTTSYHDGHRGEVRFGFEADADRPIRIAKFAVYHTFEEDPLTKAAASLDRVVSAGWEQVASAHEQVLAGFWDDADIEIPGQPELQQAVRWSLFQLFQASACLDGAEVPAKGLTSRAYEGHYFWDNEIFVLPFVTNIRPEVAAKVIRHRHGMLPQARTRARELSLKGALFPWRTITGEEASGYYLASTAQYHIDADVILALARYLETTQDEALLWDIGAELAVETARMWADLGFWRQDGFHISGVTGPDEYTVLVNDNAFTNVMARFNLRFAADTLERMRRVVPDDYASLASRLDLRSEEIDEWRAAAEGMFLVEDRDQGITAQDETFLEKEVWDFAGLPEDRYPLLLHFHPLTIYRYQVLKQPDVVMAQVLLPGAFPPERQRANFDYYDPLTTGDSSLSSPIQAIGAARVGRDDLALQYFLETAFADLADVHGNTADGVHLAAAGGVWMALIQGFAGCRLSDGRMVLDPRLPQGWKGLRFQLRHPRGLLRVELTPDEVSLLNRGGSTVVKLRTEEIQLEDGLTTTVPL